MCLTSRATFPRSAHPCRALLFIKHALLPLSSSVAAVCFVEKKCRYLRHLVALASSKNVLRIFSFLSPLSFYRHSPDSLSFSTIVLSFVTINFTISFLFAYPMCFFRFIRRCLTHREFYRKRNSVKQRRPCVNRERDFRCCAER